MTTPQVISEISRSTTVDPKEGGYPKSAIKEILDALAEIIKREVTASPGRAVPVPGVCWVTLKHRPARPARVGRNPATGEPLRIPAKPAGYAPKVRLAKSMKLALSE